MAPQPNNSPEWKPVAPGTLAGLGRRLRSRRRLVLANRVAAGAATVFLAVGMTWVFWPRSAGMVEYNFGGITCTEVRAVLPDYMMQKSAPDVARKVKTHLELCPNCRELMRKMGQPVSQSPEPACPYCNHPAHRHDRAGASWTVALWESLRR